MNAFNLIGKERRKAEYTKSTELFLGLIRKKLPIFAAVV